VFGGADGETQPRRSASDHQIIETHAHGIIR
jgi:hypothetical protein